MLACTLFQGPLAHVRRTVSDAISRTLDFLSADRPLLVLLAGSAFAAVGYCLWFFDLHFILGTSAVWNNPRGILGGGRPEDVLTSLSGYYYFIKDGWHLPIFYVEKLGATA